MAASLGTGDQAIGAFGSLLLDVQGLMILGAGNVGGMDSFLVPNFTSLVGLRAYFQSFVRAPWHGHRQFHASRAARSALVARPSSVPPS